jgi:hypothetical protein
VLGVLGERPPSRKPCRWRRTTANGGFNLRLYEH